MLSGGAPASVPSLATEFKHPSPPLASQDSDSGALADEELAAAAVDEGIGEMQAASLAPYRGERTRSPRVKVGQRRRGRNMFFTLQSLSKIFSGSLHWNQRPTLHCFPLCSRLTCEVRVLAARQARDPAERRQDGSARRGDTVDRNPSRSSKKKYRLSRRERFSRCNRATTSKDRIRAAERFELTRRGEVALLRPDCIGCSVCKSVLVLRTCTYIHFVIR